MSDSVQPTSAHPAPRGSRPNVTCGHCEKPYEWWNLKDHTKRDQVDILSSNQNKNTITLIHMKPNINL